MRDAMKVLCRKIISPTGKDLGDNSPWLKLNNEYIVLTIVFAEKSGLQIYIQTENHDEPRFFSISGFEFINQNIPSSWITKLIEVHGRKVMKMLPASWDYESFLEDMENQDLTAIELFNKEVEKMYREEGTRE
jgi:hypothetical protein